MNCRPPITESGQTVGCQCADNDAYQGAAKGDDYAVREPGHEVLRWRSFWTILGTWYEIHVFSIDKTFVLFEAVLAWDKGGRRREYLGAGLERRGDRPEKWKANDECNNNKHQV